MYTIVLDRASDDQTFICSYDKNIWYKIDVATVLTYICVIIMR